MIRKIFTIQKMLIVFLFVSLSVFLTACGGEPPVKSTEDSLYTEYSPSTSPTSPVSPAVSADDSPADDDSPVPDQNHENGIPPAQEQAADTSSAYGNEGVLQDTSPSATVTTEAAGTSHTQTTSTSRLTTTATTTATSASRTSAATTATRPTADTTKTTWPTVTTKPTTATSPSTDTDSFEMRVFELVNEERAKAGVAPLQWKDTLAEGAKIRAVEIQASFSHTRPNGETCFTVAPGVRGENIAKGQTTPEAVMNAWMNSDGHRANILSPNFQYIAVAYNQRHWVQLFG